MELTPPKQWTFWLSVILVLLGLSIYAFDLNLFSLQPLGLVLSGYGLLLVGNILPVM